ncbi:sensor histidine kinase [Glaciibacter superstes]|uniref:sensor histidine kinase n=1 Tax=Glaciibacter superstes TaxID=501023 RepID=UPI0003B77651|nr:histidine kinase [Glaciibacter superstes]
MNDTGTSNTRVAGEPGRNHLAVWFDEALSKIGLRGRFARDCLLAAVTALISVPVFVLVLAALVASEGYSFSPAQVGLVAVVVGVQALTLCIRRVNPALCLAIVAVFQVVLITIMPQDISARGAASVIAAYTVGAYLPTRTMLRVVTGVALFEVVFGYIAGSTLNPLVQPVTVSDPALLALNYLLATGLLYLVSVFLGKFVANRREYIELLRARARDVLREQQARTDAAIDAERSRMARELHDIAAHHLSGMVIQAAAVERLIDRDPQAAKAATSWIRSQGKETLANLRLVVGILRERGADHELNETDAPVPGLAVAEHLVEMARSLGTTVDYDVTGEPYPLPPLADVTVYRVMQEALSNAREHAPEAGVKLTLQYSHDQVQLVAANGPVSPHAERTADERRGLGLIGMHERAKLVGATLETGPTASGGWRVAFTLPRDKDAFGTESTRSESPQSEPPQSEWSDSA